MQTIKDKIVKYRLMEQHLQLVRNGKLNEAKRLLYLLRNGHICLGLGDVDREVESIATKAGCSVYYTYRANYLHVYLKARRSF